MVAVGVLALQSPTAHAAIIFDQTVDLTANARVSDPSFPSQLADDFQLQPGSSTITGIHWWGAYRETPPATDSFTVRIFADDAGAPAVNPLAEYDVGHVGRIDSGADVAGRDVYAYAVDITPLPLVADTIYWLSIVNHTDVLVSADDWYWSIELDAGNSRRRVFDGLSWVLLEPYPNDRLGFRLSNDVTEVPEPETLAFLAMGLAGIGFQLRRRRAA